MARTTTFVLGLALTGLGLTGCASVESLSAKNRVRVPTGVDSSADATACEAWAWSQPRHHGEHYKACMIARGYQTWMDVRGVDWNVGIAQTRPHDPSQIMQDMVTCGRKADKATLADAQAAPPITPEQASLLGPEDHAPYSNGVLPEIPRGERPIAKRVLVHCLHEHGYEVVPRT